MPFYEVPDVPVSTGLLLPSRTEALDCPRGAIRLAFCRQCGFIQNVLFDPMLLDYATAPVVAMPVNPEAKAGLAEFASLLVRNWDLRGKDLLEIGCGEGDFLVMLCKLGNNRGLGIDPAPVARRAEEESGMLRFLKLPYSEDQVSFGFDFICCRHTLDRVQETGIFLDRVRRSVGDRREPVVFFEVADASQTLRDVSFWDVRYERCSYLSAGSLARLFRANDFDVFDLCNGDDGCLRIQAVAANGGEGPYWESEDDLSDLESLVASFQAENQARLWEWGNSLLRVRANGGRAAVWGLSDKTAAYLTLLGIGDEVGLVVEPEATRSLGYVAGSGHEVLPAEALRDYKPNTIIVTDEVDLPEAQREALRLGLAAEIVTL